MSALECVDQRLIPEIKSRKLREGDHPSILTDIYQEDTNIIVWQRGSDNALVTAANELLSARPTVQASLTLSAADCFAGLTETFPEVNANALWEDIAELADMFSFLFDLKRVGLRLTALNHAMCPRFHVDRVPCRLVTTYQGIGTEWLPHDLVDRSKLGAGNQGKPDEASGLFSDSGDIRKLNQGDVGLLKGELWAGNENAGLVHRSPALQGNQQRLLLTLDFVGD